MGKKRVSCLVYRICQPHIALYNTSVHELPEHGKGKNILLVKKVEAKLYHILMTEVILNVYITEAITTAIALFH